MPETIISRDRVRVSLKDQILALNKREACPPPLPRIAVVSGAGHAVSASLVDEGPACGSGHTSCHTPAQLSEQVLLQEPRESACPTSHSRLQASQVTTPSGPDAGLRSQGLGSPVRNASCPATGCR